MKIASEMPLRKAFRGNKLDANGASWDAGRGIHFVRFVMKRFICSAVCAFAFSVGLTSPVFADLTAKEVRDALFDYYTSFGYEIVTESEEMSGDTLTISGMSLTFQIPDEDAKIRVEVDAFSLREVGDGSVSVELPDVLPMTGQLVEDDEVPVTVEFELSSTAFQTLVSGEAGDLRITTEADETSFRVVSLNVEDEEIPLTAVISSGALESNYIIKSIDDGRTALSGGYSVQEVEIVGNVNEPDGDGRFSMTAGIDDLTATFSGLLKLTEDPEELLAAGIDLEVVMSTSGFETDVNFVDDEDRFALTASSEGSDFGFALTPDNIAYSVSSDVTDVTVSSSEIPIPSVNVQYEEFEFGFDLPLSASDEPRDFSYTTAIRDLTVSEAIWSMIDPGQTLPRDPATIAIDISGKMMVLMDLLDPENAEALADMDGPPMLPVSLEVDELLASFAGALLTGDGSVTFNFENPVMLGGVPIPAGEVSLSLKGAFGLMDKLSALGLVPAEASMGIRGMIAAFSKPVGEDHFETLVELGEDGSITANGQPIR